MIKLITLWLQLRAKETHIAGVEDWIDCISHPGIKNRYIERRVALKDDLHYIKKEYKAALRERDPWRAV